MEQLFHSHTSSLIYSNATATQLICSTCVTLLNLCLTVLVPLVLLSPPAPPGLFFVASGHAKVTELVNFDGKNHAQNNDSMLDSLPENDTHDQKANHTLTA